jgi:hypothetical protein
MLVLGDEVLIRKIRAATDVSALGQLSETMP